MLKFINKKYITLSIFLILFVLSFIIYAKYSNINKQFSPSVLVIYKDKTSNYFDSYQNFNQSYILNTKAYCVEDINIKSTDLKDYDVIYPDVSLVSSPNLPQIKEQLVSYVLDGGHLFLENELAVIFPSDFTGVASYKDHTDKTFNFTYPKVDFNLSQLQSVLKSFFSNFSEYRNDDLKSIKFNTADLTTAKSIMNINSKSIVSLNNFGRGFVLTTSNLLPNKNFITGFDFTSKDQNQKYFDYSFATLNYFLRNEFLSFALKEKHGFVLKKVYGPYGRPAMAWQNHYEALTSINSKEMVKWIDLLKDYNQIPSFSLIRSTYDWGEWYCDISVHPNIGSLSRPKFQGEYEDSYYSSGKRIAGENDYITFEKYPEFKSLNEKITKAYRAYPTDIDYDNDGDTDFIVGAPDGKLYLLKNVGTKSTPQFTDKETLSLSVADYAAPTVYDINQDGLFDIVVGCGSGTLNVFINTGTKTSPKFASSYLLKDSQNNIISVQSYSAPAFDDINNDNFDDFVIGSKFGLKIYTGSDAGFTLNNFVKINDENLDMFTSPAVDDWNNDGLNDILVGDNSGKVKILINKNLKFIYSGNVEGNTKNPQGNNDILVGHNSVPVLTDLDGNGLKDLIVGQLEFGLPYDIDGKYYKYKNELKENISYALKHGIPIYPHFFTHKYKSSEQENKELELHKRAFEAYGLKWDMTGTDQHTWRTNNIDLKQTLQSEINNNIWWNFGFNPPNQPDLPRDGKEFLWSTPFLLSNKTSFENFIAFTPSPNLFLYPNVYKSFTALDMPVIYFEHIEYRFSKPKALDELKQMASFLNTVRQSGEYNFMTQEQMAKSFINTFYTNAKVSYNDKNITIYPDTKNVPELAKEYKGTLGIKFERGEKFKTAPIFTTSAVYYENSDSLYFSADKKVVLSNSKPNDSLHIVKSNVPIKIYDMFGRKKIKVLASGMQQIKIYSKKELHIEGENLKIERDDRYYTVTHYGQPFTIEIK